MTDPTTHEVHEVEKPGVVALMPGAAFTLRVNTRIRQRPKDERVEVHVTYLTSCAPDMLS